MATPAVGTEFTVVIVIRAVMGTKKTLVFIGLVVAMSTIAGLIFGAIAG